MYKPVDDTLENTSLVQYMHCQRYLGIPARLHIANEALLQCRGEVCSQAVQDAWLSLRDKPLYADTTFTRRCNAACRRHFADAFLMGMSKKLHTLQLRGVANCRVQDLLMGLWAPQYKLRKALSHVPSAAARLRSQCCLQSLALVDCHLDLVPPVVRCCWYQACTASK